jgi:hypothetical protein
MASRLGIDNTVPLELMANVMRAARGMEFVRFVLNGNMCIVSSWYRCPALNAAVHSKPSSAHELGLAVDFTSPTSGTPKEIVAALVKSRVLFDQVIDEFSQHGGGWCHVSFAPALRQQALVIDQTGARPWTA